MKHTLPTICLILFALPGLGDDIRYFQIDGLGVRGSLLELMFQEIIIKESYPSQYGYDDKYLDVYFLVEVSTITKVI